MWTLEKVREWLVVYQPLAMSSGWYLALAGGVLNKGFSDNDLDLVAMPRTMESSIPDLLKWFKFGDPVPVPGAAHYSGLTACGMRIEMAVVSP